MQSKKKWYKWTYLQNRNRFTDRMNLLCWGERCREGIVREFGMDMYPLLYLKWITYEDLRYSTWKFAQCYVEDEMAGWHHWLDGQEFEWTLGVGDGQGGLACCDSWGGKESDMTEQLNWTELNWCSSLDGRGVWERMDTCVCMAESLCCSLETATTLFVNQLY